MKYRTQSGLDVVEVTRKGCYMSGFVIVKNATATSLAILEHKQWSIGTNDLIKVS